MWSATLQQTQPASDVISDKVVLLYFSAHWCGPCRRFTPALASLYKSLKARNEDFEVVFCSMDRTEAEYRSYTDEMPWWSLPHKSPALGKLANLYGAVGIPHLVVLEKDGSVLHSDGIGEVSVDPEGKNFPWRPKKLVELLPASYIGQDKSEHSISDLNDKYLMLYFSAHWCPPCKQFTPKLSQAYTALKEHRDNFELLFVSSDHDQSSFDEYFAEMTFSAIPFAAREAKAAISSKLQVRGIPTLMIFGPCPADGGDRPLINGYIRGVIEQGDYISEFPYVPKAYGDLNKTTDNINNYKCVIVFHEAGDDEEHGEIQEALKGASDAYVGRGELKFYWAFAITGLSKTVREALEIGPIGDAPVMIVLDIPNQGSFYVSEAPEITTTNILRFVQYPGERKQL